MKENKKKIIYLAAFITILVTAVGLATFAYFSSNVDANANVPMDVATANGTVFTASSEGGIDLNLGFEQMTEANVSADVVASDNATITVRLDSENEKEITVCTYDLVWVWDSEDKYTKADEVLPYTRGGVTYNYEFSQMVDSENETDLGALSWKEVNTKTEAIIATKEIEVSGKGSKTNTHQVDVRVYNLPINQINLFNKEFRAHIEVKNNNCVSRENSSGITLTPSYKGNGTAPLTTGALASLDCGGGNASYNQKYNRVEISSLTADKINCTLTYTDRTNKNYLNAKVKSLVGSGQVFNEKGYRYQGKKVNNYVWFNNELWRIIGVFGEDAHGQTGLELTKIIRETSLGGLVWDKDERNYWNNASLNKLLNGAYLNKEDGTNGEYCYGHSTIAKVDCDYTEKGIASDYQKMIKEVLWYLGSTETSEKTTEEIYAVEKESTQNATGKIGLMYPSDYGYAAPSANCARTTALNYYSNCTGYNWLYSQGFEWMLMPSSYSANYAFYIYDSGDVDIGFTMSGSAVRPVLYLDSQVYVIAGTGTKKDPYIIGME